MSGAGDPPEWKRAVAEHMMRTCERHEEDGRRLLRDFSVPTWVREPRLHLEPEQWGAGFLAFHEVERPPQLVADLHALMPQALLRDLYRPVFEERWVERERLPSIGDRAGMEALAEARAARTLAPRVEVTPLVREVIAFARWRRELMAERWKPARPDEAPRTTPI
jgi:hypothetical protein